MTFLASFSVEARIGLMSLRVALGLTSPDDLRRCLEQEGRVDPERLARWARYHGITPSVLQGLKTVPDGPLVGIGCPNAVSPSAYAIAAAGLYQSTRLAEVLNAFADAGLDVLPLKGISLDVRCYGGPGRRKDGDHDLLIRPGHLPDAIDVLRDLGYRSADPDALAKNREGMHHAPPMVDANGPMPVGVELHWSVAPTSEGLPLRDPDALTRRWWERSVSDTLLGAPVRRFRPEDEVAYLCLHAVRHLSWNHRGLSLRLAMLEDVARLVRTYPEMDREAAVHEAQRVGDVYLLGPIQRIWTEGLGGDETALFGDAALRLSPWPQQQWARRVLTLPRLLNDVDAPDRHVPDGEVYREKVWRTLLHATLLRRRTDRVRLLAQEGRGFVMDVNEQDRNVLPFDLPKALLVPVRLARLSARLWR